MYQKISNLIMLGNTGLKDIFAKTLNIWLHIWLEDESDSL